MTRLKLSEKCRATIPPYGNMEGMREQKQETHIEVKETAPNQATKRRTWPRKVRSVEKRQNSQNTVNPESLTGGTTEPRKEEKPAKEKEVNPCRNGQAKSESEDPEDGDSTHMMNHKSSQTIFTSSKNMDRETERDVRRGRIIANKGNRVEDVPLTKGSPEWQKESQKAVIEENKSQNNNTNNNQPDTYEAIPKEKDNETRIREGTHALNKLMTTIDHPIRGVKRVHK